MKKEKKMFKYYKLCIVKILRLLLVKFAQLKELVPADILEQERHQYNPFTILLTSLS